MADVVVCGGGLGGLMTAMLLAADGHAVAVLERDAMPAPDPTEAWDVWERRGINQFRLPHFVLPKFLQVAAVELPGVVAELDAAGAHRFNFAAGVSGGALPADPRFDVITARRPLFEAAVARAAEDTPGVTIRRGTAVAGLLTGASPAPGIPHVTGVLTDSGEQVAADLVIDASGRRSPLPRWLGALGARPPVVDEEDSGFVYYGRHVRGPGGAQVFAGPSNNRFGSVSLLSLPGEDGTAGVGVIASNKDTALRRLKDEGVWRRVVAMLPGGQQILDCEPISPMASMAKIENRRRRYHVDGAPCSTGVVAVGDACAATNPSLGRGISLGLLHAVALRDTIRKQPLDDPLALVTAFDYVTETEYMPWYHSTCWVDRHTVQLIEASIEGREYDWDDDKQWFDWMRLPRVADPMTVMPRLLSSMALLERPPEALMEDSGIRALLDSSDAVPQVLEGPKRAELVAAVAD